MPLRCPCRPKEIRVERTEQRNHEITLVSQPWYFLQFVNPVGHTIFILQWSIAWILFIRASLQNSSSTSLQGGYMLQNHLFQFIFVCRSGCSVLAQIQSFPGETVCSCPCPRWLLKNKWTKLPSSLNRPALLLEQHLPYKTPSFINAPSESRKRETTEKAVKDRPLSL